MRATIDLKWLEKNGACEESVKWFKAYVGPTDVASIAEEMIRIGHAD